MNLIIKNYAWIIKYINPFNIGFIIQIKLS